MSLLSTCIILVERGYKAFKPLTHDGGMKVFGLIQDRAPGIVIPRLDIPKISRRICFLKVGLQQYVCLAKGGLIRPNRRSPYRLVCHFLRSLWFKVLSNLY